MWLSLNSGVSTPSTVRPGLAFSCAPQFTPVFKILEYDKPTSPEEKSYVVHMASHVCSSPPQYTSGWDPRACPSILDDVVPLTQQRPRGTIFGIELWESNSAWGSQVPNQRWRQGARRVGILLAPYWLLWAPLQDTPRTLLGEEKEPHQSIHLKWQGGGKTDCMNRRSPPGPTMPRPNFEKAFQTTWKKSEMQKQNNLHPIQRNPFKEYWCSCS